MATGTPMPTATRSATAGPTATRSGLVGRSATDFLPPPRDCYFRKETGHATYPSGARAARAGGAGAGRAERVGAVVWRLQLPVRLWLRGPGLSVQLAVRVWGAVRLRLSVRLCGPGLRLSLRLRLRRLPVLPDRLRLAVWGGLSRAGLWAVCRRLRLLRIRSGDRLPVLLGASREAHGSEARASATAGALVVWRGGARRCPAGRIQAGQLGVGGQHRGFEWRAQWQPQSRLELYGVGDRLRTVVVVVEHVGVLGVLGHRAHLGGQLGLLGGAVQVVVTRLPIALPPLRGVAAVEAQVAQAPGEGYLADRGAELRFVDEAPRGVVLVEQRCRPGLLRPAAVA